jgi:hypothetical protein
MSAIGEVECADVVETPLCQDNPRLCPFGQAMDGVNGLSIVLVGRRPAAVGAV